MLIPEQISGGLRYGELYLEDLYPGSYIRGFYIWAYISVNRFFKAIVDKVPLKRLYVPRAREKYSCYKRTENSFVEGQKQ